METTIYHYALCVSLTLMLFFSYRFIFGRLPDNELYRPYRQSRRLMGVALLELSANYMVHFFVTPPCSLSSHSHTDEPLHLLAFCMAFRQCDDAVARQRMGEPTAFH